MDKDKIIYKYVDYIIKNSPIDDQTFIQNRYDEYSNILGVDDKLRDYFWGVKNILLTQGFIYFDDNMFFLTEKGQEAKERGGYFKYIIHKNKPLKYQRLALIVSFISIIFTVC